MARITGKEAQGLMAAYARVHAPEVKSEEPEESEAKEETVSEGELEDLTEEELHEILGALRKAGSAIGSAISGASQKPISSSGSNRRAEMALKRREMQNKPKPETDSTGKVIPSTAQIRADAAAKRGGPVTGGGNAGSSTDSGGTSQIKNSSTFTSQGKPRTKAQQMAADRIAAKKASPLTRQLSGRERAQAMARARLAAGKNTVTGESYDQYDQIVDLLISEDYADNVKDAEFIMIQPEFIEGFNGGSIDE